MLVDHIMVMFIDSFNLPSHKISQIFNNDSEVLNIVVHRGNHNESERKNYEIVKEADIFRPFAEKVPVETTIYKLNGIRCRLIDYYYKQFAQVSHTHTPICLIYTHLNPARHPHT